MIPPGSRKLRNPWQGVLLGGVDPASSPFYSFGPVLAAAAAAGAAAVVFGASAWMAALVLLAAVVIYGLVMRWVHGGRGARGLSEEEFGGWAIKVNGAVVAVMIAAAFLVSLAAAASLLGDLLPGLRAPLIGRITGQDLLAVALALALAWGVNHRPRLLARTYAPATLCFLAVLWAMTAAAALSGQARLPTFDLSALTTTSLRGATLASFASLLGLLTGSEIFASLEMAFEGLEPQRSRKAFLSLLLVMAGSLAFLLLAGPVMVARLDPGSPTSVIGQGMLALLPPPLGTVALALTALALLAAAGTALWGMQSLALGLRDRRYAPAFLGQRNRANVADRPVLALSALAAVCFLIWGTQPARYLPIYVVGALSLLAIAGAAAVRRSLRTPREGPGWLLAPLASALATFLVVAATLVVGILWLWSGAWVYLLVTPALYAVFHFTRRKMGSPNPLQEELGRREQAMVNLGQPTQGAGILSRLPVPALVEADESRAAGRSDRWRGEPATVRQVAAALDGSPFSESALPTAAAIARLFDASLVLLTVLPARGALRILPKGRSAGNALETGQVETEAYLRRLAEQQRADGVRTDYYLAAGPVAPAIDTMVRELDADLLVMSTHGRSGLGRFMLGSNASAAVQMATRPLLLLRPAADAAAVVPQVRTVLAPLDGSSFSEQVLPWMQALAAVIDCEFILLTAPETPEPALYGEMGGAVDDLRQRAEANATRYLGQLAGRLSGLGVRVRVVVGGSRPATTILELAEEERVDLIMLATHGRGGMDRLVLGSVADRIVHHSPCPVFLLPVRQPSGERAPSEGD